ncbi:hypothetical protein N7G274_002198 [Stereocaulon virgatum]|uniref:Proteophosphoglycan ppg4 n=1 Tax=Stereocaulon virgatum TaxID=373712 RepID=A0ABR4AM42_9LECA
MSGTNPFRRKTTGEQSFNNSSAAPVNHAFSERSEVRIPPIDTDIPRTTKTKTGKTVRIISPHSATSEDEHGMPRDFFPPSRILTSPPPNINSLNIAEDESLADPFSAESDGGASTEEEESTRRNTLSNSGNSTSDLKRTKTVPANPFAKIFAGLGTESLPSLASLKNEERPAEAEDKTARPHYDVDDFKRLLLKGEKNVSGPSAAVPPPVSFQGQHIVGDSSSNTDASSISRQSIFEPITGPALQESPRSSHEGSPMDEEQQQLVGSTLSISGKIKPAAPKPRHGKLVRTNTTQIMSFEDPALSFSSSTTSMTLPAGSTTKLPGTLSGIEKSLSIFPNASDSVHAPETVESPTESFKRNSYSAPSEIQASTTAQKRNAPAPPLSRRHSLRPKPFATSDRSTPISEEGSQDSFPLSQSPPTTASKVPPPPPPRRTGHARNGSPSSMSTTTSSTATQPQSKIDDPATKSIKARPPTPPNRSPSLSGVKRQSTQPLSGSPAMAPPPPPRRRGSSASSYSYNPSRLSGTYSTAATERMRSDSNASSISQMPLNSPTTSNAENRDVLADLSALQREVDELRGKIGSN